jgi:hypothetical protein
MHVFNEFWDFEILPIKCLLQIQAQSMMDFLLGDIRDGTQYYGYPITVITSDYHGHDGLRGIFGVFLDLFSCRKTVTKSSGIPGFISVKENVQKSRLSSRVHTFQDTFD